MKKLGASIWLTDAFVDHPGKIIVGGYSFFFFMVVICLAFEAYMPSPITIRDLLDFADIRTQLFDAREAAEGEIQANSDPSGSGQVPL